MLAGRSTTLLVKLKVPVATAGDSSDFRDVAGLITLTPTNQTQNGGASLAVPYYLVARARSEVETNIVGNFGPGHPSGVAQVKNSSAAVPGLADFYAWGLVGQSNRLGSINLRAVGVQSFDSSSGKVLVFAVNTFRPWSSAATNEFDVLVDVNGDGKPDFDVVGIDLGLLTTGAFSGRWPASWSTWPRTPPALGSLRLRRPTATRSFYRSSPATWG